MSTMSDNNSIDMLEMDEGLEEEGDGEEEEEEEWDERKRKRMLKEL